MNADIYPKAMKLQTEMMNSVTQMIGPPGSAEVLWGLAYEPELPKTMVVIKDSCSGCTTSTGRRVVNLNRPLS